MWVATRVAALLIAMSACSNGGLPLPGADPDSTGLEGTARIGPVHPVCRADEPCDAALQAEFTLRQDGRVVARFASDATGHFLVHVAPGNYVVVPDQRIGMGAQNAQVTVEADGITHVDLMFDTGIR